MSFGNIKSCFKDQQINQPRELTETSSYSQGKLIAYDGSAFEVSCCLTGLLDQMPKGKNMIWFDLDVLDRSNGKVQIMFLAVELVRWGRA